MAAKVVDVLKFYANTLLENEDYLQLKTSGERIEFILKFVKPFAEYKAEVYERADFYTARHVKSLEKSVKFRAQGRKYFYNRDYGSALLSFTSAILWAPFPLKANNYSDELCRAFASKSVANFQMQYYSNALFDANNSIDLCETIEMLLHRVHCLRLMNRFSESLKMIDEIVAKAKDNTGLNLKTVTVETLEALKQRTAKKLENSINAYNELNQKSIETTVEETDESNPNFWIHPNVELRYSEQKGRYYVAKEDISAKTVVLVEKPYSVVLFGESKITYCSNCQKNIGQSIWPCIGCDEVVFCDKTCSAKAYEEYHKYECGLTGLLFETSSATLHAYRTLSRIGVTNAIYCEQKNTNINGFEFVKNDYIERQNPKQSTTESELLLEYKVFATLLNHNSEFDKYSDLYQSLNAIETAFLFEYTNQLDFDIDYKFKVFVEFSDIILKTVRRVLTNVFGWHDINRNHIGNCICNMSSLMNHSCDPNIYWAFINGNMVFKTVRNIKAGTEINNTYGPSCYTKPFEERQAQMRRCYFFDCNCSACLRDCKQLLAIRCLQCDGPVVYFQNRAIYLRRRQVCCLMCGKEFADLEKTVAKLEVSKHMFEQMIRNLDNNYNKVFSIGVAEKALRILIEVVYSESHALLDYIRQLVRVYVRFGEFGKAVNYVHHFIEFVNTGFREKWLSSVLDDLLLLTNVYYMYLTEKLVLDTKQWDICFDLYSKLIQLLKRHKRHQKDRLKKKSNSNALDQTSDEWMDKRDISEDLRDAIKLKKRELEELKREWKCITAYR